MARPSLDEVLRGDDEFGLLDVDVRPATTAGGEVAQVIAELERFVADNARPPSGEPGTPIAERILATKAKRLSGDPIIGAFLQPKEPEPPASVEDILDDELLDDDPIFSLTHVQPREVQDQPDYIGSRKPCSDFERFRPLLEAVVADIGAGRREARKFAREQEIDAGQFFIQKGMIAYVAEADEIFQDRLGNRNRRLRVIYDNGTESDPLLRSFASLLYNDENGRRITDPVAGPLFSAEPDEGDIQTGHIYVARTLSKEQHIVRHASQMLKIGVTGGDVHRRVGDAINDPTFLLAPAAIITSFTLYNVNRTRLENLLHRFFDPVRADIEIKDRFGRMVRPREWFFATPDHVTEVVRRIQDGSITRCYFDPKLGIVDTANH
ncbi:GIY-YIG nuclease family protein [Sphingomonas sp.]|uniref:GIY-YIG nuclease family protein n=1 Tax=Sphingomonas sp. TaxID=28214 RepID=UPI0025EEFE1A|nr:GIY-YIG nuclease family protein [Sphingomonas sp.]